MAAYQQYILIFEPAENRVSLFDSDKRCIERQYLEMKTDGKNTVITSVANMAFLVQADVIEVVYMDRLVEQLTSPNNSAKSKTIHRYPGPDNVVLVTVNACAVLGDELVILNHKATFGSSRVFSWKSTNINALMLLKPGEKLEWRTLTVKYDDTSKQVLKSDWIKAELLNVITPRPRTDD